MLLRRDRREELAEVWLRATGFAPVVAMAADEVNQPILPFYGDAGGVTKLVTRRISEGLALVIELWFVNCHQAQRVHAAAFGDLPEAYGWVAVSPAEGRRRLLEAAERVDIKVNTAEQAATMAIEASDHIMEATDRQRISGELRELNRHYKAYRKALLEQGSKTKPVDYQDWLHVYRLRAAEAAGSKLRQSLKYLT